MAASKSRSSALAIMVVAVVIIGGVSSYFMFRQQPETQIVTTTPTATTLPRTQTTTQPRLCRLYGRLFFDYNGDGKQDPKEPVVPDVAVALDGKNVTVTNSTGWYMINDAPKGNHTIRPFPPKNFRYMCESASEFRSVKEPYEIVARNDTRKDIGLMEGFLTLPLSSKTKYSIGRMYDWDPSTRAYLWWNGKKGSVGEIEDVNHAGIDYDIPVGEDVIAMAPGRISAFEHGPQGQLGVTITHVNGDLSTYYAHLSRITVQIGQTVSRGEKIGESGMSGAVYPHLHINNYRIVGRFQRIYDFYAPTFPLVGSLNGYWERVIGTSGDFYWKVVESGENNPNLLGFWTVRNDPKYSV